MPYIDGDLFIPDRLALSHTGRIVLRTDVEDQLEAIRQLAIDQYEPVLEELRQVLTDRTARIASRYIHYTDGDLRRNIESYERYVQNLREIDFTAYYPKPGDFEENEHAGVEGCTCTACKWSRSSLIDKVKFAKKDVQHHGYVPHGGWSFRRVGGETVPYYMGVELETDKHRIDPRGNAVYSEADAETICAMSRPDGFWDGQLDGSISGIEFVSHPASPRYWSTIKPHVSAMLRSLIHAGYRSHDNDSCGMHISISQTAFGTKAHLAKFMGLIYLNDDFSRWISQRSADSENSWARLSTIDDWPDCMATAESYRSGEGPEDGRYTALNNPGGGRFEFRLPRGTLRTDRFYKNLEWVRSMIEFTANPDVRRQDVEFTERPYVKYVAAHQSQYPNLAQYLNGRYSEEF